ncbi:MAG TPA: ATP-binding protein, partial [Anaerolineae bacterium]|nr:ATP-binding protein [Anaerolineae bacterium]
YYEAAASKDQFYSDWAWGHYPDLPDFGRLPMPDNDFNQALDATLTGWTLRKVRGWRYGKLSDEGRSRNYREESMERGVSLMALDDGDKTADTVSAMFIEAGNRPVVWCEGYLLPWRGSDGEPLIIGATEVAAPAKVLANEEVRQDRGHTINLSVDANEMWSLYAEKTYGDAKKVAQMGVREALQNSRDAVVKGRGGEIVFEVGDGWAQFSDTGIGMDADTLENKFLTLGRSGKTGDVEAVGGFGVAKAVILGACDATAGGHWSLETRNLALNDAELGQIEGFRVIRPREGTAIRWSGLSEDACSGMIHARKYLAYSTWPKSVTVRASKYANETPNIIQPLRVRSKPILERTIGRTTITVRPFDVDNINKTRSNKAQSGLPWTSDRVCVRLNGLAQLFTYHSAPGNYMVDVETKAAPGDTDYPFDSHRSRLTDECQRAISDALDPLIGETLSGASDDTGASLNYVNLSGDYEPVLRVVQALAARRDDLAAYAKHARNPQRGESFGVRSTKWTAGAHADIAQRVNQFGEKIEDWRRRHIERLVEAEQTSNGADRRVTPKQAAGLLIAHHYLSAVLSRLTGYPATAKVYGIGAKSSNVAEYRSDGWGSAVGLNLSHLANAMRNPAELDSLLFAEVVHEITHTKCEKHDEEFASEMGGIMRSLGNIRAQLMRDTEELWRVFALPEAQADKPAKPRKRKLSKPRELVAADAGQQTLFKALQRIAAGRRA